MIGYPFDSKITYDEEGKPVYDRAISSIPLRSLIKKLFTTGVMPNPSNCYQVVVGDSGMTVKVNPGFAVIEGLLKLEENLRTLQVREAENEYDRIDSVVLRLNDESDVRSCDLYVLKGLPATSPIRPSLTRNESIYEIGLADIFIPKRTTSITAARITDTRYESERCGIVSSISEFDTTTIYNQVQSDLAEFKENEETDFAEWYTNFIQTFNEYLSEEESDFGAWYDRIKGQLSEDAAGNLQNEIDKISYIYYENETLYLPSTAGSYIADTETLVLYGQSNDNQEV